MATSFSDISDARKPANGLAIFCRAPQLGAVKTRLAKAKGAPFALQLYRAMLRDCFDLGRALAPSVATIACYTPADGWAPGSELPALWDGAHLAQRGEDLGARMLNCLSDLRAQSMNRVVIIGSDAPDLPPDYLRAAFDKLSENDVVVGPSMDGGFVLIGASCDLPGAVFDGITWSRDDVCARLLTNLTSLDLSFARLESWHDVDELADLQALRMRLRNSGGDASARATREFLAAHS